jgi:hypothetical protein
MRLIVKETYGWASASPPRPAITPPTSSSVFQYVLQLYINVKISGNVNQNLKKKKKKKKKKNKKKKTIKMHK